VSLRGSLDLDTGHAALEGAAVAGTPTEIFDGVLAAWRRIIIRRSPCDASLDDMIALGAKRI
jgi:hypothetical protein